jgi:hypothetical protein
MEAWHISIILGKKPVNPITAVDDFDEHQQEPAVKWLRAFKRKHAHDNSVGIDAKASEISHILHRANASNGSDCLCFVGIEDIHGTLGASM